MVGAVKANVLNSFATTPPPNFDDADGTGAGFGNFCQPPLTLTLVGLVPANVTRGRHFQINKSPSSHRGAVFLCKLSNNNRQGHSAINSN